MRSAFIIGAVVFINANKDLEEEPRIYMLAFVFLGGLFCFLPGLLMLIGGSIVGFAKNRSATPLARTAATPQAAAPIPPAPTTPVDSKSAQPTAVSSSLATPSRKPGRREVGIGLAMGMAAVALGCFGFNSVSDIMYYLALPLVPTGFALVVLGLVRWRDSTRSRQPPTVP